MIKSNSKHHNSNNSPFAVVTLFLNSNKSIEIPVYAQSKIDDLAENCVKQHKLNHKAKDYICKAICDKLEKIKSFLAVTDKSEISLPLQNQRKEKENNCEEIEIDGESDSHFKLKKLKKGDICQNKINTQKIPKNIPITHHFKSNSSGLKKKSLKKLRVNSEETEIQSIIDSLKSYEFGVEEKVTPKFLSDQDRRLGKLGKSQFEIKQREGFSNQLVQRLKTEGEMGVREYCLHDLEKQMNEQMATLRMQKKIKGFEPQLFTFFSTITKFNPPFVKKIDHKFVSFESLSQKVVNQFHNFLIQLNQEEIQSLDYKNFKALIAKYRSLDFLHSLK